MNELLVTAAPEKDDTSREPRMLKWLVLEETSMWFRNENVKIKMSGLYPSYELNNTKKE